MVSQTTACGNDRQEEQSTTPKPLWSKVFGFVKLVLSCIPGISYFVKKWDDGIDGAKHVSQGEYAKGIATATGYGDEYNILTDVRMGAYEKTARITNEVSDDVTYASGGKLAELAVQACMSGTRGFIINQARKADENDCRDVMEDVLGRLSEKEWEKIHDSLDKNNDGHLDQVEFRNGLKTLRKNAQRITTTADRERAIDLLTENGTRRI